MRSESGTKAIELKFDLHPAPREQAGRTLLAATRTNGGKVVEGPRKTISSVVFQSGLRRNGGKKKNKRPEKTRDAPR